MRRTVLPLLFLLVAALAAGAVTAEMPSTLSVQGILRDAPGNAVPDGDYTVTVRLHGAAEGGTVLWSETLVVTTADGVFSAVLGESSPLALDFADPYWLELQLEGGDPMLPRIPLTASAYAFLARGVADGAVGGDALADGTAVRSLNGLTDAVVVEAGDNVILSQDGNTLTIAAVGGDGGGDITAVLAGDGLDGGGVVGEVTLDLALGGVDTAHLADGAVTEPKIAPGAVATDLLADGAVTEPKIAPGAVTAEKLAASAVAAGAIAAGAVTDSALAPGSVSDVHVAEGAAIAETKLALDHPTHDNANDPTDDEKDALAGSHGAPSAANPYVTDSDPRLDGGGGGTPSGPAGGDLAGTYPNPVLDAGAAVLSLNGKTGNLYLKGTGGAAVTASGDTLLVAASGGGGGGIGAVQNSDGSIQVTDPAGPTVGVDVATGGIQTSHLAADAVTGEQIAPLSVENSDVAVGAAIDESKLALNHPTHDNANDPTGDEKDALAGSHGAPSAANPYVTDSDPRLAGGGGASDSLFWALGGNTVSDPAVQYLGTDNNVPLQIRANGSRALQLERRFALDAGTSINVLAGAGVNLIASGVVGGTIGGGGTDDATDAPNRVTSHYSTVAGGANNWAGPDADPGNDRYATVSGGRNNTAGNWGSTIAGGEGNQTVAAYGTISGGSGHLAGLSAAVPGGSENEALGDYSLAAGRRAKVRSQDGGTFVWADAVDENFTSTGENQFLVQARGGMGVGTNAPQARLHVGGTPGVDGIMFPDGTLQTSAAAGGAPAWELDGNAGVDTTQHFMGTTDAVPLHLRVNSLPVMRFYHGGGSQSPVALGGHGDNHSGAGVEGAIIAGGGADGQPNRVTGDFTFIGSGRDNRASGFGSAVVGGSLNRATANGSFIGGGGENSAEGVSSVVVGGTLNLAGGLQSVVGGGSENEVLGWYGSLSGGLANRVYGRGGTVAGGGRRPGGAGGNTVWDDFGTVAGGSENEAGSPDADSTTAPYASVGGGFANAATGAFATVGGGSQNDAVDSRATVAGGSGNLAEGPASTVGGGYGNLAEGAYSVVAGGGNLDEEFANTNNRATDDHTFIGGGGANRAGTDNGNPSDAPFAAVVGGEGNRAEGHHSLVGGGEGNLTTGRHSVVGGGEDNAANSTGSAILGGAFNESPGLYSVVGGGSFHVTKGGYSFIGGGVRNEAAGSHAIVLGGADNAARGNYSAILGGGSTTFGDSMSVRSHHGVIVNGRRNTVIGEYGTVLNGTDCVVEELHGLASGVSCRAEEYAVALGRENEAGFQSVALGGRAKATDPYSFVWNSEFTEDLTTTSQEQFLVRADGGFGIGTNVTPEALNVLDRTGSTGVLLGGAGTAGPHGIIFDDETPGEGLQLFFRTSPNQLVLEKSSAGTGTDAEDAFSYDRDTDDFLFHGDVQVERDAGGSPSYQNHMVRFRSLNGGANTNVLALRVAATTPGSGYNFVTFINGNNASLGSIQGDGAGGVTLAGPGADYAEYLRRAPGVPELEPGTVVGVDGGVISLETAGAQQVMVVSRAPLVLGNSPADDGDRDDHSKVAFLGQAPVRVTGAVQPGDCLVASGRQDGLARAVSAAAMTPADWGGFLGVAWSGASGEGESTVTAAVGLAAAGAVARSQQAVIESLEDRLARIEARLDAQGGVRGEE